MFCLKCPIFNLAISNEISDFTLFCSWFVFYRGIVIFGFNFIYKMEDMLNLGLYRIFSKTKINWFQGWVNIKNTWTLQNHPT
jgi:hypothetical protein